MEQFKIKEIIKIEIINNKVILITDIIIYIIIGIIIIVIIEREGRGLSIRKKLVIKEAMEEIIEKIIRVIVSGKERYKVILKGIFMSILMYNVIGLVPYNKTITSEIILALTISMSLLIGITVIGVERNGIRILKILVPQNTPIFMAPLLVGIETISYIARGLSLGLRLGANMIAGHTLLKIIITFIYTMINMDINKYIGITWENKGRGILDRADLGDLQSEVKERIKEKETTISINYGRIIKGIITIMPIIILILIIILEIGVGVMQALVFVIITGIYINDVDQEIK